MRKISYPAGIGKAAARIKSHFFQLLWARKSTIPATPPYKASSGRTSQLSPAHQARTKAETSRLFVPSALRAHHKSRAHNTARQKIDRPHSNPEVKKSRAGGREMYTSTPAGITVHVDQWTAVAAGPTSGL